MHFEKYEKLIVVERGVELINWPHDVPFVNASAIGSFSALHKLWAVLGTNDDDKRCRWVQLSEVEWDKRVQASHASDGDVTLSKSKSKRTVADRSSESSDSGVEQVEKPCKKMASGRKSKVTAVGKENDAQATLDLHTNMKRKGARKSKEAGKGK
jgi:hypothetical protein